MSVPVLLEVRRAVEASPCSLVDVLAYPEPHPRAGDRDRRPVARVEVRYPGGERGVVEVTAHGTLVVLGPPGGPRYASADPLVDDSGGRGGSLGEVLSGLLAEPFREHRDASSNATFRELVLARERLGREALAEASVECGHRRLDEEGALSLSVFVEEGVAASAVRLLTDLADGTPLEWALRRARSGGS